MTTVVLFNFEFHDSDIAPPPTEQLDCSVLRAKTCARGGHFNRIVSIWTFRLVSNNWLLIRKYSEESLRSAAAILLFIAVFE